MFGSVGTIGGLVPRALANLPNVGIAGIDGILDEFIAQATAQSSTLLKIVTFTSATSARSGSAGAFRDIVATVGRNIRA